jgi:anhydro-N-acetylmuramic acid kinase
LNGGTGAPIIPIFHKLIAEKFKLNNCMFVNIGGVTNITNIKENHIEAYDLCFGNALSDDLVNLSNKNFSYDNDGDFSRGGSLIEQIEKIILSDPYFSKPSPKSLDRNYFHKYFNIIKEHSDRSLKDTLFTLWNILGSKILYASNNSKLNVIDVDELGINGDFIESQGIGYLAIRRLLKLPSSFDKTTGIKKETFLGEIN